MKGIERPVQTQSPCDTPDTSLLAAYCPSGLLLLPKTFHRRPLFSSTMPSVTKQTYADRAAAHPIPVAQQLLAVCDRKKTNLCVSVDVTSKASLLRIADAAGPYCCCIKVRS